MHEATALASRSSPALPSPGTGSLPPPTPPPEPQTGGARRTALRAAQLTVVAAAIGVSFLIDRSVFVAVATLFLIVVPFEKLYPRRRDQRIRRSMVATDVGFALAGPLLNIAGIAALAVIGGLSLFWLPGLAMRPVVATIPAALLPVVGFLLFDLFSYWTHRFAHEVPFMWRFHTVHHSPEHMDWVSGFRIHPLDGVVIAPPFFFLLGAGFGAELAGVLAVFQIVLGIFFHANVRVRWRLLDRVAANPEFHHWHHSSEPDAVGHNYGAALPWWDLLFGTYFMPAHASGRRPQQYGVTEPLPAHLLGHLAYPCRGWRKHLWLWRHPVLAVRTLAIATRNLLVDIRRSALRPTHSVRREHVPGSRSTNSSLLGPAATPMPAKKQLPHRGVVRF